MTDLAEHVAALTELIRQGQTIEAMERFYADDVIMQENEKPPRVGKPVCLDHERQMLAGVTSFKANLINQAIDEANGVVFTEWLYEFNDLLGQRFLLMEVAVQYWRNELIYSEKFYYNKTTPIL